MSTPENWTPEEQRLHDALHRAADRVQPGPDGLARIRRRTAVVPMWRRPLVLGLAGATALAAAVIVGGVILLDDGDGGAPVASETSTSPSETPSDESPSTPVAPPSTPPSDTPTAPSAPIGLPVYYVSDSGAGPRLVREFVTVDVSVATIQTAVHTMLSGPPADPDYGTLWQPGVSVDSARITDDVIEVDLSGTPAIDDPSEAEIAIQQLVYTATAAAAATGQDGSLPVRVTIDGAPATDVFGVDLSEPVERADPLEVRQLVVLFEPTEDATVTSPVTVRGEAAAFEATVLWELRRDGEPVDSGHTETTECCTFAPFELELDLEPGSYEIVMSESDPSGGEGRPPTSDSRTFTVE
ncbi:Gmad2 immunoglobulin-like domain-containing protein [Jiangella anatolica]|uniref:GerMN domain-containing protein n=1 Tax=Jiangella anatolica TaxID=2670374 RepID=A0A2W2BW99_9ACTN|nr:Gmad2 immunoglobulin-like domain-containing protein [Jiangella anatolica]PZF80399.1 hypothetical protein C1I92_26225 [Jiangella anatolica]